MDITQRTVTLYDYENLSYMPFFLRWIYLHLNIFLCYSRQHSHLNHSWMEIIILYIFWTVEMKEHSSKDLDNQETPACVFRLPDFKSLFTWVNTGPPKQPIGGWKLLSICQIHLVGFVEETNLQTYKDKVKSSYFSLWVNLLAKSTEGVAEGFCCQMEKSLQEHVDLQGVEAFPLIWKKRTRKGIQRREREQSQESVRKKLSRHFYFTQQAEMIFGESWLLTFNGILISVGKMQNNWF